VHSLSGLFSLEIGASSEARLGGGGLILSHEACRVVVNATKMSEFWGPPRFGVGGRAFGRDVGGD